MIKKDVYIKVRCTNQQKEEMKAKYKILNFNNLSNFILTSTKAYSPINPMTLNSQYKVQISPLYLKQIAESARFVEELDMKYCFTDEDLYELNRRFSQLCQL